MGARRGQRQEPPAPANQLDVIFNGSGNRKPLGYAEVSLVFDNEGRRLPVSTTEVIVTRRLDRKGESSYAINRQSCRLKGCLRTLRRHRSRPNGLRDREPKGHRG